MTLPRIQGERRGGLEEVGGDGGGAVMNKDEEEDGPDAAESDLIMRSRAVYNIY